MCGVWRGVARAAASYSLSRSDGTAGRWQSNQRWWAPPAAIAGAQGGDGACSVLQSGVACLGCCGGGCSVCGGRGLSWGSSRLRLAPILDLREGGDLQQSQEVKIVVLLKFDRAS